TPMPSRWPPVRAGSIMVVPRPTRSRSACGAGAGAAAGSTYGAVVAGACALRADSLMFMSAAAAPSGPVHPAQRVRQRGRLDAADGARQLGVAADQGEHLVGAHEGRIDVDFDAVAGDLAHHVDQV